MAGPFDDLVMQTWDPRPASPAVAVDREAVLLVRGLFDRLLLKEDVLARLREYPGIPDEVRQRAQELATGWRPDPLQLADAAWTSAVVPARPVEEYQRSLKLADTACTMDSVNPRLHATRSLALYRLGRYEAAVRDLSEEGGGDGLTLGLRGPKAKTAWTSTSPRRRNGGSLSSARSSTGSDLIEYRGFMYEEDNHADGETGR